MNHVITPPRLLALSLALSLMACGDEGTPQPEADTAAETTADDGGGAPEPADITEVAEGDAADDEEAGGDAIEEAGDAEPDADDVEGPTEDVEGDASVIPSDVSGPGPEDITEPIDPSGSFEIGQDACCLSVSGDRAVWAEGGALWVHTLSTGESEVVAEHTAHQTDPALSGDILVWADDRGGDLDLWMVDLSGGEPMMLFGGPGDQDAPTIDGTRVAFVNRSVEPYTDKEADIWMIDLEDMSTAMALVSDLSEQSYPHIHGDRVIWTDFRNDPEGTYNDFADPFENNGDIYGYDLTLDEEFIVTNDPSKQLRPTIEGEDVVWLDWRGINPEPKYSEFQVYTRAISPEMTLGPERLIAWSSWETPALWQRPSVLSGKVAWIGMPETGEFKTGVFSANLADDTITPSLVAGSVGTLEAVSLSPQGVLWLGAGTLGIEAMDID
jgi:beta propeller repeat protein